MLVPAPDEAAVGLVAFHCERDLVADVLLLPDGELLLELRLREPLGSLAARGKGDLELVAESHYAALAGMDDIRRGGKLLLKRALVDDLAARPEKYLAQIYRVVEGVVPLHDLLAAVVGHSLRKSDGTLHLEMPSELDRKVDYVGDDQAQSSLGAEIRDRTDRVERKPPVTVAVAIELQRLAFVEPVVETGENLVRLR